MKPILIVLFTPLVFLVSCLGGNSPNLAQGFVIQKQKLDTLSEQKLQLSIFINPPYSNSSYRGLYYNLGNYFISGQDRFIHYKNAYDEGSVYIDSNITFSDLRDVHVLNNGRILIMSITQPAKILIQDNSKQKGKATGKSDEWKEVYFNSDSLTFLDGMDFWNDSIGLIYGDPLNDYQFILKTTDGGDTWNRIPSEKIPKNLPTEAGFAASGTGIVCKENGIAYIGLGGEETRVLITHDYGESWSVVETPMLHGSGGKGIYSMAFKDAENGIAVGGNWENIECDSSKIYTTDGGRTWHLSTGLQHYRSCVTYIKDNIYVSTGTSGTDITYDGGKTWTLLDSTGFNAIQFDKHLKGVAVGSFGTICEVELKYSQDKLR